jgi:hypothetical protein
VTIDEESSVSSREGLVQAFDEELGRISQFYAKQARARAALLQPCMHCWRRPCAPLHHEPKEQVCSKDWMQPGCALGGCWQARRRRMLCHLVSLAWQLQVNPVVAMHVTWWELGPLSLQRDAEAR